MWVITVFSKSETIRMLEFDEEQEAKQAFLEIEDYKILTEYIDVNDPSEKLEGVKI